MSNDHSPPALCALMRTRTRKLGVIYAEIPLLESGFAPKHRDYMAGCDLTHKMAVAATLCFPVMKKWWGGPLSFLYNRPLMTRVGLSRVGFRRIARAGVFSVALCGLPAAGSSYMHSLRSHNIFFLLWCIILFIPVSSRAADGSFHRDGVELYYRTAGSGTPVIFLSGGPGIDVDYMMAVAEYLPESYQRVFFEQRGTGRSQLSSLTPANMTLQIVVDDLEALRIHLKLERLFLIGHSWGGMLAMAYAGAYPERIDAMVLIGSGGPTVQFSEWFDDNIRARLRPEDLEAERYWSEAAKRGDDPKKTSVEIMRAIIPGYFFDRAKGLALAAELREGIFNPEVDALLTQDMHKSYDVRAGLQLLTRPVLIIQGHQDPIGGETAGEIHSLIKSSTLKYIRQAGHFPWLEQPDDFRRILTEFVDPLPKTRGK